MFLVRDHERGCIYSEGFCGDESHSLERQQADRTRSGASTDRRVDDTQSPKITEKNIVLYIDVSLYMSS
jgi:hypothetical protein